MNTAAQRKSGYASPVRRLGFRGPGQVGLILALGVALSIGNLALGRPSHGDDIFAGTNVLRIEIEISRAGAERLRETDSRGGHERPRVLATVREGGVVYTNVEVHLKGAVGSFRSFDDDPGLTLNFDKVASGQSFHGLHKISLNNSVQDRSFLSEKICRELFAAAGVPVPRAGHAKVTLNRRDLGIHVLTEGFNRQFLKRYYQDTGGNLYDGGFCREVTDSLEVTTGEKPRDHPGLEALCSAAREQDPAKRLARLERALDLDCFLSFIAMDVMQCDWDGYAMAHNNWRIFHDRASNRMVFFPHGLDQMFGVERTTPECPIVPHMQGMIARAVIQTPDGRRRYLERMAQLYTNVFHVDAILKRVDEVAAVIRPVIAESSPQAARRYDNEAQWLKRRIIERDESLSRQLGALATQPHFDSNGVLKVVSWRRMGQIGDPPFRQEKTADGKILLTIGPVKGSTKASWRSRVLLEGGTYRFEGMIRTRDVKSGSDEASGGAGFRISGAQAPRGLSGTADWRRFAYPFQVQESGSEVELVCELRAVAGEVTFDASTLKLVRLRGDRNQMAHVAE
jgi:spore coat protein H